MVDPGSLIVDREVETNNAFMRAERVPAQLSPKGKQHTLGTASSCVRRIFLTGKAV